MLNSAVNTLKEMDFSAAGVNWKKWRLCFENFLLATGKEKDAENVKIAILLNMIGEEGVEVYLTFPEKQDKTVKNVLDMFDDFCLPKKNTVMEAFKFGEITQKEGQPIDSFVRELKTQSNNCDFECSACKVSYKDRMIINQIILKVRDQELQKALLTKEMDTLDKVIEKCKQFELLRAHTKMINQAATSASSADVMAIQAGNRRPNNFNASRGNFQRNFKAIENQYQQGRSCWKCGRKHPASDECPAKGRTCNYCRKLDHFEGVCFLKRKHELPNQQSGQTKGVVNTMISEQPTPTTNDGDNGSTVLQGNGKQFCNVFTKNCLNICYEVNNVKLIAWYIYTNCMVEEIAINFQNTLTFKIH